MSGGALFSNNAVRGASKNLIEFKAGKMTLKGKMLYPDTRKGLVYAYQTEDSLIHFCFKDRTSGAIEDDLIIFPDDCEFKHLPQCKTGRAYVLRFKSSTKRHFFWLQDPKTDKDEENCRKLNEYMNHPPTPGSQRSGGANPEGDLQNLLNNMSQQQLMQLFGGVGNMGLGSLLGTMRERPLGTRASTTTSSTPVTTTATRPPAAQTPAPTTVTETLRSTPGSTPKNSASKPANSMTLLERTPTLMSDPNLFDLQRHLWNISTPPGAEPVVQRGVATELTNTIPMAVSATESLEQTMGTHLPAGDTLCTTLSSPQFSQALSMFWSALQSGQAGPVVRQFGLGPDAVNAAATGSLEDFIMALETETNATSATGQTTTPANQSPDDNKSKKETSATAEASAADKKDDNDDGMALD